MVLSTCDGINRQTCSHKERQGLVMEDDRTWTPSPGYCTLWVLTKSAGNRRLTGSSSPGAGSLVSLPSPGSVPCGLCDVERITSPLWASVLLCANRKSQNRPSFSPCWPCSLAHSFTKHGSSNGYLPGPLPEARAAAANKTDAISPPGALHFSEERQITSE